MSCQTTSSCALGYNTSLTLIAAEPPNHDPWRLQPTASTTTDTATGSRSSKVPFEFYARVVHVPVEMTICVVLGHVVRPNYVAVHILTWAALPLSWPWIRCEHFAQVQHQLCSPYHWWLSAWSLSWRPISQMFLGWWRCLISCQQQAWSRVPWWWRATVLRSDLPLSYFFLVV